jgi:hypothetical protein
MPDHYEPSDIAQRLQLDGLPDAEFTVYDGAGWEYIVDLPNEQAFRIIVTPYEWVD